METILWIIIGVLLIALIIAGSILYDFANTIEEGVRTFIGGRAEKNQGDESSKHQN